MTSLTSIDLEDNDLTYLGTMPSLPALEKVNLKENNIESLGNDFLGNVDTTVFKSL